jgi:uncharacterized membrane protein YfcA
MTLPDIVSWLPIILACAVALLLSGLVKGILSLGLPLVGMPLLTLVVDVPAAVGILMIPLILSNLIQAVEGSGTLTLLKRFWPLILCLVGGTFIGTALFAALDRHVLLLTVGALAIVLSTFSIMQPHVTIPSRMETWLGPPIGLVSGVIGGMSTLFGPLLAVYVVGLKLPRDDFVKAISLLYLIAAICLTLGGTAQGTAGARELTWSAVAMIPVYGGMLIGQRVRRYINPEQFRILVLGVVWLTGANLIRMGLGY